MTIPSSVARRAAIATPICGDASIYTRPTQFTADKVRKSLKANKKIAVRVASTIGTRQGGADSPAIEVTDAGA
jgi:hypothetical protein